MPTLALGEQAMWDDPERVSPPRLRDHEIFIEETRGGQNTPEAELRSFVNYRNEAAHGSLDQVLGPVPLSEYADFIVAVCKATDELVRWNWVRYCKEKGRVKTLGKVTERFKDNIVVAKIQGCTLKKSMAVLLLGQHYCYTAAVESIHLVHFQR